MPSFQESLVTYAIQQGFGEIDANKFTNYWQVYSAKCKSVAPETVQAIASGVHYKAYCTLGYSAEIAATFSNMFQPDLCRISSMNALCYNATNQFQIIAFENGAPI